MPRRRRNVEVLTISDSEEESGLGTSRRSSRYNLRRRVGDVESGSDNVAVVDVESGSDNAVFVEEVKPIQKEKKKMLLEDSLEISLDEDSDEEVEQTIRVIWTKDGEIHRFTLKSSEQIHSIFKFLSNRYNVPTDCVRIRNGNKIVSKFDTLQLLNLKVTQVLEAYELKEEETESCRLKGEADIEVKCLLKSFKKPIVFYLHKNQSVHHLLFECVSIVNCSVENLQLKFDGETIEQTETPDSLGLEGGECFEVYIKE